jgi:hypothetical protein
MIHWRKVPWTVRYAAAQIDMGRPVPSWLLMAVQMWRNGGHGYQ